MLIISRKEEEKLRIGDDVVVTVIGITDKQIRFGIEAPKKVPVKLQKATQKFSRYK